MKSGMKLSRCNSRRKSKKKVECNDEKGMNKNIETLKEEKDESGQATGKRNKEIESEEDNGIHVKKKRKQQQLLTTLYKKKKTKKKKKKGDMVNLSDCSCCPTRTQSIPKGNQQHTAYRKGDMLNLSQLLFTEHRDYLITGDGQVQANHLEGKVIVLHLVPLVPWSERFMRYNTSILLDIYHQLQPKGGFEVVFVGVVVDDVAAFNPDELCASHPTLEECFQEKFSIMPWTAIPFSDVKSSKYWDAIFPETGLLMVTTPASVVIDPSGMVSQCQADRLFYLYGAQAYPFTDERTAWLQYEDGQAEKHPSITKLLASPERNHLINNNNQAIPLHNLEDKVVGLYFCECYNHSHAMSIHRAYESLAKEKNFEIVFVYIHDGSYYFGHTSEELYWKSFKTMPWLALPFKDPVCKKLLRIFDYPMDPNRPGPDPNLVIIGPQGKFVERYGADILMKYGISAYPFTRKSVAKLKAERIKKLNMNMFWKPNTSFIQKDGSTVQLAQLVGKRVILIVEKDWYCPDAKFWRMLRAKYLQMKGTNDEFEVIHLCKTKGYSHGKNIAPTSWLSHPSRRLHNVSDGVFEDDIGLYAFDRDGRVIMRTTEPSIKWRNVGFPFGSIIKEILRILVGKFEWDD